MARPTKYNQELAERICEHIAAGQSLRSFCRQPDAPALSTVTLWIVKNPEFSVQYVQAREAAGFAHADHIADIVDAVERGEIEPNAAKVMMDGRKWTAERMAPKRHMPQSLVNHESPNGSMTPKPTEIIVKAADDDAGDD